METLTIEQIKADEIIQILSNIIQKQLSGDNEILGGYTDESKQKDCNLL